MERDISTGLIFGWGWGKKKLHLWRRQRGIQNMDGNGTTKFYGCDVNFNLISMPVCM